MFGQPIGKFLTHLAGRQFDDPVVIIAQLQLAHRGHHAVAVDTPDIAHRQGHIQTGHIIARLGQNHRDPRARIGCAADDLLNTVVRGDLAHPQTIGVGVLFCLFHLGQGETGQRLGRVHDLFDLQPEIGQRLGDFVNRGCGVEVLFEPGEGEFHRIVPRHTSVGACLADRSAREKRRARHPGQANRDKGPERRDFTILAQKTEGREIMGRRRVRVYRCRQHGLGPVRIFSGRTINLTPEKISKTFPAQRRMTPAV